MFALQAPVQNLRCIRLVYACVSYANLWRRDLSGRIMQNYTHALSLRIRLAVTQSYTHALSLRIRPAVKHSYTHALSLRIRPAVKQSHTHALSLRIRPAVKHVVTAKDAQDFGRVADYNTPTFGLRGEPPRVLTS